MGAKGLNLRYERYFCFEINGLRVAGTVALLRPARFKEIS